MKLDFQNSIFICHCTFDERLVPKEAGFKFDGQKKIWFTQNLGIAARLRQYATEAAKNEINARSIVEKPWSGVIPVPPGKTLRDYQIEMAKFALSRNRAYLAADPGTGKTPTAVACTNAEPGPVLYICPPFLIYNVEREFKDWATWNPKIEILSNKKGHQINETADIFILPDSIVDRPKIRDFIMARKFRWGFVDEAHRYKNDEAKRTVAVLGGKMAEKDEFEVRKPRKKVMIEGYVSRCEKVVPMSGTPMPNARPMELFPVLNSLAPDTIEYKNKFHFGLKYCGGHETEWGWDFSGASNLEEFKKRIFGKFMIRIKKADVLKDLPPYQEQILFLENNLPISVQKFEKSVLSKHADLISLADEGNPVGELATWRREVGETKVQEATDFFNYLLEETNEKILVFAHHTSVIEKLIHRFAKHKPLAIHGATPKERRQGIVDLFQLGQPRLLVGNIAACGVGFNITRANRVIFLEYDWVDEMNAQARDRVHRMGLMHGILVQYLALRNSLDEYMLNTIFRKRKTNNRVMG